MVEVNNRVQEHTRGCSTSPLLCKPGFKQSREGTDSDSGKVLVVNNSDVDQRQHTDGHNVIVYVLNKDGRPLMPCKPAKARHLLEQKKARVVTRKPFTIQLLWDCEHHTQPLTMGVDSGYKHIGVSVVNKETEAEVFNAEIRLRDDIPKKLLARRMYRRNRRNKLWYRPPRFNNRKKPDGWLAPSIQHKLNSHFRVIQKLKQLLPINKIIVEVAGFDIQRIKNPDIQGEQYQQGCQFGFWNIREYVLHRDDHMCQHCHGRKKDPVLQVHHLRGRSEGATNQPDELLTVCKTCHREHHQGVDVIPVDKKIRSFKPETFMSIVRWKLVDMLRDLFPDVSVSYTFGYLTKHYRIREGLGKSHGNDAFVIADGTRCMTRCKQIDSNARRRNNRCLQLNLKGFKPSIRRKRYNLQPGDMVSWAGLCHLVKGMHCRGSRVLLDIGKSVALKQVELICYGKGLFC
jgi:hypothetical protein